MKRIPTYLRVVVTTRCNYSCAYCHREGDRHRIGIPPELPRDLLKDCLAVAVKSGIRKIKLLGGEPLLRDDLPEVINAIRSQSLSADISIITAGAVPVEKVDKCWQAGLSRVNVTIHGFSRQAFMLRNRSAENYDLRKRFIERLIDGQKAPIKLNYVYSGQTDLGDLSELLEWAAGRKLLINVLDNLSMDMNWKSVEEVIRQLRGKPERVVECPDPDSLPTVHWKYSDGLKIEIKNRMLGHLAPYQICETCGYNVHCKEGIFALRLTHDGCIQPCMDRTDLMLPLARILAEFGHEAACSHWKRYLRFLVSGGNYEIAKNDNSPDRLPRQRENNHRAALVPRSSLGIS